MSDCQAIGVCKLKLWEKNKNSAQECCSSTLVYSIRITVSGDPQKIYKCHLFPLPQWREVISCPLPGNAARSSAHMGSRIYQTGCDLGLNQQQGDMLHFYGEEISCSTMSNVVSRKW